MNATPTPDQHADGTTTDGSSRWSVARYDTLVVTTIGSDEDDEQFATEQQARTGFADAVESMRLA